LPVAGLVEALALIVLDEPAVTLARRARVVWSGHANLVL
jgi:hypothetical protein